MPRKSKSQELRNILFKVYETLNSKYKKLYTFQEFYENEIDKVINDYKNNI